MNYTSSMNRRPFRDFHLLNLLNAYDQQHLPLDLFISMYFRANKALGSKDRGAIAEAAYAMIRWDGLLNYLCGEEQSWEKKLDLFLKTDLTRYQTDESIPLHIRLSFPEPLFN